MQYFEGLEDFNATEVSWKKKDTKMQISLLIQRNNYPIPLPSLPIQIPTRTNPQN